MNVVDRSPPLGEKKAMNLPNRLTVLRLIMVPFFVLFLSIEHAISYALAYVTFIAATITDYYDGKIARERGIVTNFGKLLDPLADKVLLAAAFIMILKIPDLWTPAWTVIAIITREFLVTGVRLMAANDGLVIAANKWGKAKMVVQAVYIYTFLGLAMATRFLALQFPAHADLYRAILGWTSYVAVIFVALFTLYSGVQFAWQNWDNLKLGEAK